MSISGHRVCLLLLAGFSSISTVRAQSPAQSTAPTANTLSPEAINKQWVAATAPFTKQRERILNDAATTIANGPFRDDWESLSQQTVPDWYRDAKFGIFIHWGVFSVPASGSEWYSRNMYLESEKDFSHHVAKYGPQTVSGYKDFIPMFHMEHFDPAAWANLFHRAGARYVVPVAEHHDGFPLYASDLTEWTAAKMGPHRDLFGDLAKAVREQGMKLGASSHRAEHDWFFDGGRHFASDVNDPKYASLYGPAQLRNLESTDDAALSKDFTYVSPEFRADWLARTSEIVQKYHPDLLYFDWWVGQASFRDTERRFAAFYYDYASQHDQTVVMNYKFDNMHESAGVLDVERGELPGIRTLPWQTDTSLSNESWGYIDGDTYKQAGPLIHELVDVVSKNGNLLLNIGPRSDGTIPEAAQKALLEIGGWLDVNGEAIYGSRPWLFPKPNFGEGPTEVSSGSMQEKEQKPFTSSDFRFTTNKGFLYAIELGWPTNDEAIIHSFASSGPTVGSVDLLGYDGKLVWSQKADGLHISLPKAPVGRFAFTFRISLKH